MIPERFGIGFHHGPVGPLPDLPETSPSRYDTSPARLTSALVYLAGAHQPLFLLSTGNARPGFEPGKHHARDVKKPPARVDPAP